MINISKGIKKVVLIFFLSFFIILLVKSRNIERPKLIMEDSRYESPIYYLNKNKNGPKIVIVAGIHGNEIAGIEAAEKIIEEAYDWAEMVIIPRANIEAARLGVRNPYYMSDLNRSFPGRNPGTDSQLLADEIFTIIKNESPDMVFDLHEWEKKFDEDESLLEYGLIFNSMENKLWESVEKLYNEYKYLNLDYKLVRSLGPPSGSINKEVSERLKIPVLTIESNMGDSLEKRFDFQLDIIKNTIKNYEMD